MKIDRFWFVIFMTWAFIGGVHFARWLDGINPKDAEKSGEYLRHFFIKEPA